MATDDIEIEGLDELIRHLRVELPEKFARQIARNALDRGAAIVKAAAETTAPVLSGALKADIVVEMHVNLREPDASEALIGPGYVAGRHAKSTDDPGVYGFFVEEGHKGPGHGVSRNTEYRAARRRREPIVKEFGDKDTPPHPFMRPAWEMSKEVAQAAIVDGIRDGLKDLGFTDK